MIHEILPHRFDNKYIYPQKEENNDFIFHFSQNSLLMKRDGDELHIPSRKDFPFIPHPAETVYLFSLNDIPCYLIWEQPDMDSEKFIYKEIGFFRTFQQPELAWVSIVGFQLMNWYSQNKFCGRCGSPAQIKSNERAITCKVCDSIVFPKISPAVIVAIVNGDKILLAHNNNFPENWYSLVAGYADIGESLEETVIREVKEEVGLDVSNIRYYKSQPWPFSGSMMVGFFAKADVNQPVCADEKEIHDAAWFTRGSLPAHPSTISIAGEMIEKFERDEI